MTSIAGGQTGDSPVDGQLDLVGRQDALSGSHNVTETLMLKSPWRMLEQMFFLNATGCSRLHGV